LVPPASLAAGLLCFRYGSCCGGDSGRAHVVEKGFGCAELDPCCADGFGYGFDCAFGAVHLFPHAFWKYSFFCDEGATPCVAVGSVSVADSLPSLQLVVNIASERVCGEAEGSGASFSREEGLCQRPFPVLTFPPLVAEVAP
jgi:hypothetical protein